MTLTRASSRNETFYSASAGGTQRTLLTSTEHFMSADEGFSPTQSFDSELSREHKSSWVWEPPPPPAAAVIQNPSEFSNACPNPINSQSGMPEPLRPPTTGELNDKIRQLGEAARHAQQMRLTAEHSTNDDRPDYADAPKRLAPQALASEPRPGVWSNIPAVIPRSQHECTDMASASHVVCCMLFQAAASCEECSAGVSATACHSS